MKNIKRASPTILNTGCPAVTDRVSLPAEDLTEVNILLILSVV